MTHIKDMRVQPYTMIGEPMFFHAPIGAGDVPVLEMLQVLQDGAPDPENLQHCVEVLAPPEHDAEAWVWPAWPGCANMRRRSLPRASGSSSGCISVNGLV